MRYAYSVKSVKKQITLLCVFSAQSLIVFVAEFKSGDSGFLKRGGSSDGKEIMDFLRCVYDFRRSYDIAKPPTGYRIRFRKRAALDNTVSDPGKR